MADASRTYRGRDGRKIVFPPQKAAPAVRRFSLLSVLPLAPMMAVLGVAAFAATHRPHHPNFAQPTADQDVLIKPGGPYHGEAAANWQPPFAMQHGAVVAMDFVDGDEEIARQCGPNADGCSASPAAAKADHGLIVVHNPCAYQGDFYADTLCHELGHINGWPGDHAGGHFIRDYGPPRRPAPEGLVCVDDGHTLSCH